MLKPRIKRIKQISDDELICLMRKTTSRFYFCKNNKERAKVREECRTMTKKLLKRHYHKVTTAQVDELFNEIVEGL